MIKRSTLLVSAILSGAAINLNAQEFFNNGGTVQVNGIVVFVNGGVENNAAGTIVNDGNFWSTNNGIAPGSLTLNGGSSTSGTGKFYVEQNFVNNATWSGVGNEVIMNSNTALQNISGTSATSFQHLTLAPSTGVYPNQKVQMNINVTVTDSLWLNNRELATQGNVLTITSPTAGAITNNPTQGSEGFISSAAPGYTQWQTATASSYFFPLGSSNGTLRYRPLEITPSAAAANSFDVRFNNTDATLDGYNRNTKDTTFCFSNPNWYHTIARSAGSSTADVKVYYEPVADGNTWDGLAQWQTSTVPVQWTNIQPTTAGTSSYFSTQVKPVWAFADPGQPYILIEKRPVIPTINCPGPICDNQLITNVTAAGSASNNYQWTVPGGSTIISGQGTSGINLDFGSAPSGSSIVVTAANAAGTCFSSPVACAITLLPAPTAAFTSVEDPNNQLSYTFTDVSTGATTSVWDINGSAATGSPVNYTFSGPGTYNVNLITANGSCYDTTAVTIVVDYIDVFSVPNVFTPNGDGANDFLFITHSGFKEFKFELYNRWGQVIFTSQAPSFNWDGKDPDGQTVSDGTYYWIVKGVNLANNPVEKEGYLMVYKSN